MPNHPVGEERFSDIPPKHAQTQLQATDTSSGRPAEQPGSFTFGSIPLGENALLPDLQERAFQRETEAYRQGTT